MNFWVIVASIVLGCAAVFAVGFLSGLWYSDWGVTALRAEVQAYRERFGRYCRDLSAARAALDAAERENKRLKQELADAETYWKSQYNYGVSRAAEGG